MAAGQLRAADVEGIFAPADLSSVLPGEQCVASESAYGLGREPGSKGVLRMPESVSCSGREKSSNPN